MNDNETRNFQTVTAEGRLLITPGNPVATESARDPEPAVCPVTVTDILVTPAQRESIRARLAALWDAAHDAKWRHRAAASDFKAAMRDLKYEVSVAVAFGLSAHVDPLLKLDPPGAL